MASVYGKDLTVGKNVCQDFLNPEMRTQMLLSLQEGKSTIIDINNDGINEKVILESQGTQVTSLALTISDSNDKYINIEGYENVRLNRSMQILLSNNHYYIVHFADVFKKSPTYITSVNSKNIEQPICKFNNVKTLKLLAHDDAYSPSQCNLLLNHVKEGKTIRFDIPSTFAFNSSTEYKFINKKRTTIGNIGYLDYNNDGKKEYLQLFEDKYDMHLFYRVLEDDRTTLRADDSSLLRAKVWFSVNNKIYAFEGNLKNMNNHLFIRIEESNVSKEICTYAFDVDIFLENNTTKKN